MAAEELDVSVTITESEARSQTSPERSSTVSETFPDQQVNTQHERRPASRKAGEKLSLKERFLNSLKRKRKNGDGSTTSAAGDLETSDFSYHRPSPPNKKRGSPGLEPSRRRTSNPAVQIQAIKAAMEEGIDGLPSEIRGGTPLHYYVWTDSVKKEKTDFLVSLLTTAEVDVDCMTDNGNTPLHLAVKKGDLEAVKVLVAFGASVNTTNNRGQTPLDIATIGYLKTEQRLGHAVAPCNRRVGN